MTSSFADRLVRAGGKRRAVRDDTRRAEAAVTTAAVRALYARPPSFTDLLPWVEYLPESRAFLLEDGVSVGALFEFAQELRDGVRTCVTTIGVTHHYD